MMVIQCILRSFSKAIKLGFIKNSCYNGYINICKPITYAIAFINLKLTKSYLNIKPVTYNLWNRLILTLFRMGLFGAAHEFWGDTKRPPLPKSVANILQ